MNNDKMVTTDRVQSAVPRTHMTVLDGIRGIAIVMVLCVHFIGHKSTVTIVGQSLMKIANCGVWGVDLFFVLSGYLITGLLYDSKKSSHYFRNFYVRRTLRIFPLYYAVLILLFVVLPMLPVPYPVGLAQSAHHQGWLWSYMSNTYLAIHHDWVLPYVEHFWSLAVEEQFYLIWPVVVLICGRRMLLIACVAATCLALELRINLSIADMGELSPLVLMPCRLDALCVGSFVALIVPVVGLQRVVRTAKLLIGPLCCLVLLTMGWHAARSPLAAIVIPVRGTLIAVIFGALLAMGLSARRDGVFNRLLSSRTLCFMGTRSYGIYVFHGVIAYWLGTYHVVLHALSTRIGLIAAFSTEVTIGMGVSIGVAAVSYELFEKYFLRLKEKFTVFDTKV